MRRLFRRLFELGTVVVATSNRPPRDLYLNGLQRDLFLPFISDLETASEVVNLDSPRDYRMRHAVVDQGNGTYLTPLGEDTAAQLESIWREVTRDQLPRRDVVVELRGRLLKVPMACSRAETARFTFQQLCEKPLGSEEYLALAAAFHTVFVTEIPVLSPMDRNAARRFITLVDALYENRTRLICTAAAPAAQLYVAPPQSGDEAFAFDRTVSRLMEMQSEEYLTSSARPSDLSVDGTVLELRTRLSESHVNRLWERYDCDGDGVITPDELGLLLADLRERRSGHRNVLPEELAEAMRELDEDGNGIIEEKEFGAYLRGRRLDSVAKRWLGQAPRERRTPPP